MRVSYVMSSGVNYGKELTFPFLVYSSSKFRINDIVQTIQNLFHVTIIILALEVPIVERTRCY